jgi:DNA topoisomerase I
MASTLATAPDQADLVPDGLVYVSDEAPGVRRRRCGRGFAYRRADGRPVRDPRALQRIKALAVPPAWTDVWICADPAGHVQATGRDARGRKQYRYHGRWREVRDEVKFDSLVEFAEGLPNIRRRLAVDLRRHGLPKDKVLATVVRLLEATLVRVGNEEYARDNDSYGLTTLRDRHARVGRERIRFVFRGKGGKEHEVEVSDVRLARVVKRCQDIPGQQLFQYLDDDGRRCPVQSRDVNDYLRDAAGTDVTAKLFRTWIGTLLVARALASLPRPRSERQGKQRVASVIEVVADQLANTPPVCRQGYVHPAVVDSYLDGSLPRRWFSGPTRPAKRMLTDERRLLHFLRQERQRNNGRLRATA